MSRARDLDITFLVYTAILTLNHQGAPGDPRKECSKIETGIRPLRMLSEQTRRITGHSCRDRTRRIRAWPLETCMGAHDSGCTPFLWSHSTFTSMKLRPGIVVAMWLASQVPRCECYQSAKRLFDDLMQHYDKLRRPVKRGNDTLSVGLKLKLSQIIDLVGQGSGEITVVVVFFSTKKAR